MKIITSIAILCLFAGIISSVLYFMNYNLKLLSWMNDMPEDQQWYIRAGLVILGLAILLIFRKRFNTIK